jgi:hypothetical protein
MCPIVKNKLEILRKYFYFLNVIHIIWHIVSWETFYLARL